MNHLTPHHNSGNNGDLMSIMNNLTTIMKDKLGSITKTGPAAPHHMGKILPMHNLFKPGAHPKSKKAEVHHDNKKMGDQHKDQHHEPPHHDAHKAVDHKGSLKATKIE